MPSDSYWGYADPALLAIHYDKRYRYFRLKLWERDGHRCQICGRLVPLQEMDIDHILPRRDGGPMHWDNLRATCIPCNRGRPRNYSSDPALVTAKEVLAEFPMSRATLYRLVEAQKIPAHVERQPWHQRQHFRFCLDEVRAAVKAMDTTK